MEDKELSAWLCLCLTPGISSKNIRTLLQLFGSAEAVFNSQADQTIVQGKKLKRLLGFCRTQAGKPELKKKVRQTLLWKQTENRYIITLHCKAYPPLLKEILDPPLLLYIEGSQELLSAPQIAMVGSRKASPGWRAIAKTLAGA